MSMSVSWKIPLNVLDNRYAVSADITGHTDSVSNPHSVTAAQVGLGNVDDTADIDKPISDSVQTALDLLISGIDWKEAVATFADLATTYPTPDEGWSTSVSDQDKIYRYDGSSWVILAEGVVPLATAVLDGKLSSTDFSKLNLIEDSATADQTGAEIKALYELEADTNSFTDSQVVDVTDSVTHAVDVANPHVVTAAQVGLGSVDNTSDTDKPVSTASEAAYVKRDGSTDITGAQAITDATDATSPTTGALTVAGGVGIAKDLVVSGTVSQGGEVISNHNFIINGDMSSDLRQNIYTLYGDSGMQGYFTVDGVYIAVLTTGAGTNSAEIIQSSVHPTAGKSLSVDRYAFPDEVYIRMPVPIRPNVGLNPGGFVTMSFWSMSPIGSIHRARIAYGEGIHPGSNSTDISPLTTLPAGTSTWIKHQVTAMDITPGALDIAAFVEIHFDSTALYLVTDVKLERGSSATPFIPDSRFMQRSRISQFLRSAGGYDGADFFGMLFIAVSTTTAESIEPAGYGMWSSPSLRVSDQSLDPWSLFDGIAYEQINDAAMYPNGLVRVFARTFVSAIFTPGTIYSLRSPAAGAIYTLSAEL